MSNRQLLFSVTASDCDIVTYVGPGNGGQKKNKTHSGVMITHRASGAQGRCHDGRSQLQNKQAAFRKMCESTEFKKWHTLEVARRTGDLRKVEEQVDKAMSPTNLKIEHKDENGRWTEDE